MKGILLAYLIIASLMCLPYVMTRHLKEICLSISIGTIEGNRHEASWQKLKDKRDIAGWLGPNITHYIFIHIHIHYKTKEGAQNIRPWVSEVVENSYQSGAPRQNEAPWTSLRWTYGLVKHIGASSHCESVIDSIINW